MRARSTFTAIALLTTLLATVNGAQAGCPAIQLSLPAVPEEHQADAGRCLPRWREDARVRPFGSSGSKDPELRKLQLKLYDFGDRSRIYVNSKGLRLRVRLGQ